MKISFALGLALTFETFALMGGAPNTAHAADANHSGTVCKNYNAAEVKDIDYLTYGTRNLNARPRYVVCPLVTTPPASGAPTPIYVNGFAASVQTISCSLYSYDVYGNILGINSFPSAMTGAINVYLNVPVNYAATADLLCLLPPSGTGVIYDVNVVQ
jgi:hypothetical protein